MKEPKKAFQKPETGPFYLVPDPKSKKYIVLSAFDEPGNEEVHLFLWAQAIEMLRRRFRKADVDSLEENYRGIPRGRVIEKASNQWVVAHGKDFPIEAYKSDIFAEYKLNDVDGMGKVAWEYDPHEAMIGTDKELVQGELNIKFTPTGFTVGG
jgi:hypothetical protein